MFNVTHEATGAERAVKVVAKSINESENEGIRNEFEIVKDLDHPNLIKVYHLFESTDEFHIVFDLASGGDLLTELERAERLPEEDSATLMNNLLSCLNYCHSRDIVHRDLKPENILLKTQGEQWDDIKLIDFGLAKKHSTSDPPMTDLVGTHFYVSPPGLGRKLH